MSAGSIYNASTVNDSAEDVRQVLERQEQESDRLENVRACCDGLSLPCVRLLDVILMYFFVGKHDVGSLTRRSGTTKRLTGSSRR